MTEKKNYENSDISVRSMFGHNTQKGLVMLRVKDVAVQITPFNARHLAQSLIEAATAAETDEIFMAFLTRITKLDEKTAAGALLQLRDMRDQLFSDQGRGGYEQKEGETK